MKKKRRIYREPKKPAINVIVLTDRHATVARVEMNQLIGDQIVRDVATGSARREPGDVRDDVLATNLALGRALETLGVRLQATARVLVMDAAHRQEHEAKRRVKNRLREVRKLAAQPEPVHLPLMEIYQRWGLEAAKVAAVRRGDEVLLAQIVQSDLPEQHGRHEKADT